MHLQQLQWHVPTVRHGKRASATLHVCHAHSRREDPLAKHVNPHLLFSVCATLATAVGALQAHPAVAAVNLQREQTGHELVAMRPNTEVEQAFKRLRRSGPFQSALSSIVNVADTLSLATAELLDLTAADTSGQQASATAGLAPAGSRTTAVQLHSWSTHSNASQTLVSAALSAAADSGKEQLQEADSSQLAAMGVAHRMSQEALAVASEALKMAALLESQDVDPSYTALLQQIEAAARSVSVVAGDIAQPGVWVVVLDDQSAPDAAAQGPAASSRYTGEPSSSSVAAVAVGPILAAAPSLVDSGMQL